MRIEGHHDGALAIAARVLDGLRHELLVSAVQAVEDANRHRGRAKVSRDAIDSVPNIHGHHAIPPRPVP